MSSFLLSYFSLTVTGSSAGRNQFFPTNKIHKHYAYTILWSLLQSPALVRWHIGHLYHVKNVYTNIPEMHVFNNWYYFVVSILICYCNCEIQWIPIFFSFLDNLNYSTSICCWKKDTLLLCLNMIMQSARKLSLPTSPTHELLFWNDIPAVVYHGCLPIGYNTQVKTINQLAISLSTHSKL